jgi:23S rRNA (guanine2445-N2)-methyltransferase / 23S rRNA (guanine2069-N7)-methyltransferase
MEIQVRTMTGLEGVLAAELRALGLSKFHQASRVILCEGDLSLLYRINFECRTAIRALRLLLKFDAAGEKPFYDGIQSIDWSLWLKAGGTLAVSATVHSSFTTHTLFVAQLTKDAIVDQFRTRGLDRPSVDLKAPDLRISITLFKNQVQVCLDSSGESLHRRGYRLEAGEAPLNETLASGILALSGWDSSLPFLDPFCGSGTFPIEAALRATRTAPGLVRKKFAFQNWPDFDSSLYRSIVDEAQSRVISEGIPPIQGVEIDPAVTSVARENVKRAGMEGIVHIEQADFFSWTPGPKGVAILNPPYDERLKVEHVGEFWERLGMRLKQSYPGWKASILCGNPVAGKALGLSPDSEHTLFNGSIECRLFHFRLGSSPALARPVVEAPTETFGNRLRKSVKHLSKWAKREGLACLRVYDRDIPELPFILDLYQDRLVFSEIQRNHDRTPLEHKEYLRQLVQTACEVLKIPADQAILKTRKAPKTGGPSESSVQGDWVEVGEHESRFLLNFNAKSDPGLSLDQRALRGILQKTAKGKDFLSLYSSTGTLSVAAARGGAASTTSVDSSGTFLEWARKNLELNGQSHRTNHLVRADVVGFLANDVKTYDLIVLDPPARSINRATLEAFDLQQDHGLLLKSALERLRENGQLYFVVGSHHFELEPSFLSATTGFKAQEITRKTTPLDFERRPGFRCWLFTA